MNIRYKFFIVIIFIAQGFQYVCAHENTEKRSFIPSVTVSDYGRLSSGELINQYRLATKNIRINVINYGGIITHIEVPDKKGKFADVVLGYDNLIDYEHKNRFFGAIVGRYANRISNGQAIIDGKTVQLNTNRPPHQLHGGQKGFDKVVWQAETSMSDNTATITLSYTSLAGEEGYPGTLQVKVIYQVTNQGQLSVTYQATTDKTTIYNPTQHTYFNLSGTSNTMLDHTLTLNAQQFVELNKESVPTGELLSVNDTPFDFLSEKTIGRDINANHSQINIGKGYDHFFVAKPARGSLSLLGTLYEPTSGRKMTVETTEVGAQLYSANYLNETVIGKNQAVYQQRQGICIETGQMPNAPAEPNFTTVLVKPSNPFTSQTVFTFTSQ